MPTLDEFKKIQEKKKKTFKPKRYAPYLLQKEVISDAEEKLISVVPTEESKENKESNGGSNRSHSRAVQPILGKKTKSHNYRRNDEDKIISNGNLISRISKLYGIQKKLFFFLVEACKENNGRITYPLTAETLVEASGTTYKTMKKILNRLLEQDLIIRAQGRRGRGGFSVFGVSEEAEEAASSCVRILGSGHLDRQRYLKSSGSVVNEESLPADWSSINFVPLENIGFSNTQLKQLYKIGSLTPEIVQESIHHFAFGLENKGSASSYADAPLKVLIGNLRKGNAWIESNYESPIDASIKQLMKFRKQQEEKRKAQMDELFSSYFNPWYEQKTDSFLKTLIPKTMRNNYKRSSPMILSAAKEHYKVAEEWQGVLENLKEGN